MTKSHTQASGGRRPPTILVAAVLLALEALIALGYAVLEVGQVQHSRAGVGVRGTRRMALFGVGLVLVARGAFLGRRWSRGPAVARQLILSPLAWSFVGG